MLIDLTDYAFASDGPVQRILGQHRPMQADIAHQYAKQIDDNRGATQTVVSLNEQRGGLGKTAAYCVVLMLDIALTGERAAYATFTRALRNSIKSMESQYNEIVRLTLEENGQAFEHVSIVEIQSPTAILSPSKCEAIRLRLEQGRIPLADVPEVQEFLYCYDQSESPCEFADLYATIPNVPCNWTELSLALGSQDRDTEHWKTIERNRQEASNPRTLILLTHAMVIRDNLRSGKLLNGDEQDEALTVKSLVIDEADKLPAVANTALRFTVSRNEILDLARDIETNIGQNRRAEGMSRLSAAIDQLRQLLVRVDVSYLKDDTHGVRLSEALARINDALLILSRVAITEDVLIADRIRLCRDNLRAAAHMMDFEHPILHVALARDPLGLPDIHLTLEIGGGRRLISQMWRTERFETIAMVSALMTNMPPYATLYDRFRRDIDLDRTKGDRFIERTPLQPPYGTIGSVFVADRVGALLPTDTEELNLLRQTSLDGLATQITVAALRRAAHERIVVLFQSYAAMHEVFARLPDTSEMPIKRRVVMRQRRHLPVAIYDLTDRPYGIWFGVEWEGINFVNPETMRTMVDALIITRMPLAPRDEIRAMRLGRAFESPGRGQSVALFEGVHAAYRKLYHGVLMGIRSPDDHMQELWLLDPRWPLPSYVYQRQPPVTIRSIAGSLFTNFDRVVEPWDIQSWYKIDAEGGIEPILEPVEAE